MKWSTAALMAFSGLIVVGIVSNVKAQQGNAFTGTVRHVWEDGFRLNIGNRNLRVDSWTLCGDFTPNHVRVGDRLTVTGEFERGEFDAFSITNSGGAKVCQRN